MFPVKALNKPLCELDSWELQIKMSKWRVKVIWRQLFSSANNTSPIYTYRRFIQTVYLSELPSTGGSVSQVRESSAQLMGLTKGMGICVLLLAMLQRMDTLQDPRF